MTAANYPVIRCDGGCGSEIGHPAASTATEVRRFRRPDGWRQRPGGRDICPPCWRGGQR